MKKCNIRKPSLSEIKKKNKAGGGHFFDRKIMEIAGRHYGVNREAEKMRDFDVICENNKIFVVKVNPWTRKPISKKRWLFHPKDGALLFVKESHGGLLSLPGRFHTEPRSMEESFDIDRNDG